MVQINPKEYVDALLNGGVKPELYAKTARIAARPGVIGEEIITKMADGHTETKNTVKAEGDMIATNPGGEEYIIDAKTFAKRYELDPDNPKQYRPKGGAQEFIVLNEDVEFTAPWGEEMAIKAGGVLNITGRETGDIYGIQKKEFEDTYGPCDKNGTIIAKEEQNGLKSFDTYFEGYKNYDNGGPLDKMIIADAKKVYDTLKTPDAINHFYKKDYNAQCEIIPQLRESHHSGFSLGCVCSCAFKYAEYVKENKPSGLQQLLSASSKTFVAGQSAQSNRMSTQQFRPSKKWESTAIDSPWKNWWKGSTR